MPPSLRAAVRLLAPYATSLLGHALLAAAMALMLAPGHGLLHGANDSDTESGNGNDGGDVRVTIAGIERRDTPDSAPATEGAATPEPDETVIRLPVATAAVAATPPRHASPPRRRPQPAPSPGVQPPTREAELDADSDLTANANANADSDTMPDPFESEPTPMAAAGDSLRTSTTAVATHLSAPELDHLITASVRSWRYRPRVVEGAPRPFCHLMKFVYSTR